MTEALATPDSNEQTLEKAALSAEASGIDRLVQVMAALRTPVTGCPWDLEQTFETIAPYTIEEAYEVSAAIQDGDMDELKLELGDLLLQVVFHARMAEEQSLFNFNDVAEAISIKMIRRHPHVFAGTEAGSSDAVSSEAVRLSWEDIKAEEKAEKEQKRAQKGQSSVLDDVPPALPALIRAVKLQKRAARVGFDWPSALNVLDKAAEELQELREAIIEAQKIPKTDHIQEELGDLLFVFANLARHFDFCPEDALRQTNHKFTRRFQQIEHWLAAEGRTPEQSTLEEMDKLWDRAKTLEKSL